MNRSRQLILLFLPVFLLPGGSLIAQVADTLKSSRQDLIANGPVYYSPGGTYSDWYFPTTENYSSLEWTFVPVADPPPSLAKEGLLHYYAYNFSLVNASNNIGGGYAGFQTNGIFKDSSQGKVINFSIWGSNGGKSKGMINAANGESGGYQIMYKYNWAPRQQYRFELKPGPSGEDSLGKWWGLWITNKATGVSDFVGEQRVPSVINGKSALFWNAHTSMFGEDLHWWKSLNGATKYKDPSSFQPSAMAAMDITANGGTVKPAKFTNFVNSGKPVTGSNGFKSVSAKVSIYQDANFNVQHNLGYWASPAPNFLTK
ncbi:hypothetical protein A8C56_19130 [Niabella ginsenosidivorans]|uniref:DUF3472 domain-containing protein n=1 Tax=Niabella ginsenosidivorans TaxID=1176587 RepID=A0A1A9I8F3_9BACT|nr:hypothetical protein [Niabella ginsenosidivorans]ANH82814.1 hypothetical protein A8C56_19130 [Niabella ginsenosidivorans]